MHTKRILLIGLLLVLCISISFPLSIFLQKKSEQVPSTQPEVLHIPEYFTSPETPDFPPPVPDFDEGAEPQVVAEGIITEEEMEISLRKRISEEEYRNLVLRVRNNQITESDDTLIQGVINEILAGKNTI